MSNEDPYSQVSKGKLKLKGDWGIKKKKKKSKAKKLLEQVEKIIENEKEEESKAPREKTKAELAFQKMQEKMVKFLVG